MIAQGHDFDFFDWMHKPSSYLPKIVAVYLSIPEMSVWLSQREFSNQHFCSSDKLRTNPCPLQDKESVINIYQGASR